MLIRDNNIFAKSYQMMGEELRKQQANLNNNCNNEKYPSELQLMFSLKPWMDNRRYNFKDVTK